MAWSLACAATISRWTPASTSFASARLRPKSAMSTRPSGRLISTTSAHDPSPSAPISTSLKTQATYPPSVRERVRKYPTAVAPPISRRSPQTQGAQIGKGVGLGDPHDIGAVFFALSSDADQPHDPGHVASTSAGIQARKYLFRSRAPNLAAVPG